MRAYKSLFAGAILAAGIAFAQTGMKGKMQPAHYDPAKETMIQGTVEAVQTGRGIMMGVIARIKVQPDKNELVFLGPAWFLEEKKFTVEKGDEITLTGARWEQNNTILARVVKKGEVSLSLRDMRGVPMWSRHRR